MDILDGFLFTRRFRHFLLLLTNPSHWLRLTWQYRLHPALPCPFCGSEPGIREAMNASGVWAVFCDNFDGCLIRPRTPWMASKTEDNRKLAITEWNKRGG